MLSEIARATYGYDDFRTVRLGAAGSPASTCAPPELAPAPADHDVHLEERHADRIALVRARAHARSAARALALQPGRLSARSSGRRVLLAQRSVARRAGALSTRR
jgi:hypothetical protein